MSFKDFAKKTSGMTKPDLPELESSKPAAAAPKDKGIAGPPNKAAPQA